MLRKHFPYFQFVTPSKLEGCFNYHTLLTSLLALSACSRTQRFEFGYAAVHLCCKFVENMAANFWASTHYRNWLRNADTVMSDMQKSIKRFVS